MVVFLAETNAAPLVRHFPLCCADRSDGGDGWPGGRQRAGGHACRRIRSQTRSSCRVLAAVGLCLLILVILAEWVIPDMEADARAIARAGTKRSDSARQVRVFVVARWRPDDSHRLVKSGSMTSSWNSATSRCMTCRTESSQTVLMVARRAVHSGSGWILSDVLKLEPGRVGPPESISELTLDSDLRPELFAATVSRPRLLSLVDLTRMRALLSRNGLDPGRYDEAFWERVYFPLNVLAMVLIGLPVRISRPTPGQPGAESVYRRFTGAVVFCIDSPGPGSGRHYSGTAVADIPDAVGDDCGRCADPAAKALNRHAFRGMVWALPSSRSVPMPDHARLHDQPRNRLQKKTPAQGSRSRSGQTARNATAVANQPGGWSPASMVIRQAFMPSV